MPARLISARQVRAYLGVDGATLSRMRKAGSLPPPIPGTRFYDFEAIKRTLDQIGHPEATITSDEDELIERAKLWGESA
jgi:hypothetical protein